ncbi:MAG: alkylhydroperoxidase, partial [Actinobacteria bacterium]|nr:alkylhydroperoxidase [Actinomycetota bacterium]
SSFWIKELRDCGFSDGEVLEINQVTAYFAYVNRVVLGLGCSSLGETLGRSPAN